MNTTEGVPYNGEESELREVVEETNSTVIGVNDVIQHVLKNTELNKEGILEQVIQSQPVFTSCLAMDISVELALLYCFCCIYPFDNKWYQ